MSDRHGQAPSPAIHWNSNREKALRNLMGILEGISADKELNADEIIYLDTWLRDNWILRSDPDVLDLIDVTSDILEDDIVTLEEREDLYGLIINVLECNTQRHGYADERDAAQKLLGFCQGITADRKLNTLELLALTDWLDRAEPYITSSVLSELVGLIREAIQDGIITTAERKNIFQLVDRITGQKPEEGITHGLSYQSNDADGITSIEDCAFCFSGVFLYGTRAQCQAAVRSLGGKITKGVTRQTNFLIVGEMKSRDWTHSSFGLKIAKAKELGIPVISEDQWIASMTRLSQDGTGA